LEKPPAVQVSPGKASVKVDTTTLQRVEQALATDGLTANRVQLEGSSIKVRLNSADDQLKARDSLEKALNPNPAEPTHVVALNLVPRTPAWLQAIHASPMYLGLDLRGGVHFMLQVDMQGALTKKTEALAGDLRTALREKKRAPRRHHPQRPDAGVETA
jgi:preprotein translocase subunit SecD